MKKVLITGGLGFLGSELAFQCVDSGYNVTILTRSLSKIENIVEIQEKVKIITLDIKDIGNHVIGFDYIYHFAGTTDNYHILDDPYIDIDINCNGTIALLEACRKYNPDVRILYGSTFFVNGNPESLPVTPSSPCNPLGLYGATRLAGEHFCRIYNNVYNLNVTIVRFSNVFGIREQLGNKKKAGFNYIISLAIKGEAVPLYNNGEFYRDYIYLTDAVSGAMVVAEKGDRSKIYYVARGEFVKFRELIGIVMTTVGGGVINPVEPPDFHKQVGISDFVCDINELKELGWAPEVSLVDGIRKTVEFYRHLT